MKLEIGVIGFLAWAAYFVLFTFFERTITARFPDSAMSRAFGYLH